MQNTKIHSGSLSTGPHLTRGLTAVHHVSHTKSHVIQLGYSTMRHKGNETQRKTKVLNHNAYVCRKAHFRMKQSKTAVCILI